MHFHSVRSVCVREKNGCLLCDEAVVVVEEKKDMSCNAEQNSGVCEMLS